MKIIHTADIHLGSRMDSRFSKEIADERKAELRNTFKRLVEYAKENDVSVIMLCGDVFDSDRPFKKDKDFFYGVITANHDIEQLPTSILPPLTGLLLFAGSVRMPPTLS